MKTLDIERATESLSEYASQIANEAIILTRGGIPCAALMSLANTDLETASLSTNPKYMALIEKSRAQHRAGAEYTSAEVRRMLGIKTTRAKATSKARKSKPVHNVKKS